MSKRYSGRFSPKPGETPPPVSPAGPARRAGPQGHAHPLEGRTYWITLAAAPLLLAAFGQPPLGLATALGGFGLTAFAMWMTREGLRAEAAFNARRVARRPAIPRKIFGAVLTGLGLGLGSFDVASASFLGSAIIGGVAMVLHLFSFGLDPLRDKGMEGIDTIQQDRAARIVSGGEGYLRAMGDAILRLSDRHLSDRVDSFAATARGLFRQIEENPADIANARRYLGVYLMGARDATVKFADLYAQTHDAGARRDYEALLSDLETNFAARTRQLIAGSRTDLDVEMEVLRDRLLREGVAPDEARVALDFRTQDMPANLVIPTRDPQKR